MSIATQSNGLMVVDAATASQARIAELTAERDRLRAELTQVTTERDNYLKSVVHFMCTDYECPYTKEELLACVGREKPLAELIDELSRDMEVGHGVPG